MSERRLRWSGCLFVCLSAVGASSLYAQTLDPSISGPARIVADRAYAAYQNGDYAIAKAMAQAALQMAPGTDSVRRLLAATESGGSRAGRWSSNPFLITTAMGAMAHGESMAVKVMSPSLPSPTVPVQMPQPTTPPRLSGPSQALTARPEKAPAAMAAPLTRTPVRPMEPEHALAVQALPSRTAGAGAAASPKLTTATPQKIYDLIKSGDAATAATLANNTLQVHPGDRRMWEAYTNALFVQGKFQEADEAVAKAIKRLGTDDGLNTLRDAVKRQLSVAAAPEQDPNSPGWKIASQAYKNFDRGDFPAAAKGAIEAVRLTPENKDYRQLLVISLQSADRFEEADQAIDAANAKFGEDPRWMSARSAVRGRLATRPAEKVYRALERNDLDDAVVQAKRAVALAPDVSQYHDLLLHVLLRANRWADAEAAATEAIRVDPEDATPRVLRAYARQRLGQFSASAEDFDLALKSPDMDDTVQRNLRLIAADAALAADEPDRALALLEAPVFKTATDAALLSGLADRRRLAQAAAQRRQAQPSAKRRVTAFAEPSANCRLTPYGRVCLLEPGQRPATLGYEAATMAYRAMGTKNFDVAIEKAREAVDLAPASLPYRQLLVSALVSGGKPEQLDQADTEVTQVLALFGNDTNLLMQRGRLRKKKGQTALANADFEAALAEGGLNAATEVGLLADLGRKSAARQRLDNAVDQNQLTTSTRLDVAYLSARVGDDDRALAAFTRSDEEGKLPPSAYADVAFTALRLKMDPQALRYFRKSIDAVEAEQLSLAPQALFDTRRAVAEVSRDYGATVGLSLRGTGALSGGAATSSGAVTDSAFAGAEAYWRPFGYRGGQYAEVFARGFYTLKDKAGGPTGVDSIVGAVGARWKPLTDHTLVLSFWRQFPVSAQLNSDWVAQASYFTGTGLDLRVADESWWTAQFSADAGRYLQQHQTYALVGVRVGRSYRLDSISSKLVAQPHAVLAADYNSSLAYTTAVGVGPGLNLRYWFREAKYAAPQSYVDFTVQYRAKIAGDQRAKGPFVTLTTSY